MPAPPKLPPLVISVVPVFASVHYSEIVFVPENLVPAPEGAPPPMPSETGEPGPTALRAWNGEVAEERRAFDQTRIEVAPQEDGARNWQFYWQTRLPDVTAARWEISTMPFYPGQSDFPPVGLIAYGDASLDAESPVQENFYGLDLAAFEKAGQAVPRRLYMRVVPIDDQGQPVGETSNAIRIDRP